MARKVKDVMTIKVITARKGSTLREVVRLMYQNRIGAVPIVDEVDRIVGIVTERDVIRFVSEGIDFDERVDRYMTKNVITLTPEATTAEALSTMSAHDIRHLPVVDRERRIIGILSMRDLLMIAEL